MNFGNSIFKSVILRDKMILVVYFCSLFYQQNPNLCELFHCSFYGRMKWNCFQCVETAHLLILFNFNAVCRNGTKYEDMRIRSNSTSLTQCSNQHVLDLTRKLSEHFNWIGLYINVSVHVLTSFPIFQIPIFISVSLHFFIPNL